MPIATEQTRQFNQLMEATAQTLERHGTSLAEIRGAQEEFRESLREVLRLRDDFEGFKADASKRWAAILQQHRRGGPYSGFFGSRADAEAFGRLMFAQVRLYRGDPAPMQELQKAAISSSTGAAGGALLTPEVMEGIVRNVESYGVFESNARIREMRTERASIRVRASGLTCYYPDLGVAATASDPTFRSATASLVRYMAYTLVDNNMLRDDLAVPLAEFIAEELSLIVAYSTDLNAFVGDGTSTYAGVTGMFNATTTHAPGLGTVVADTGDDTFAEVVAKTTYYLQKMVGSLPQWAEFHTPKWYMSRSIFCEYVGVRDAFARPLLNMWLDSGGKVVQGLLGYPVAITQVAPRITDTAVSKTMIVLAALHAGMALARHVDGAEVAFSTDVKFAEDQGAFRICARRQPLYVDGSAICQLKTAAA